ncbi:sugar phosphorylase [Fictibacillus barbaricus]|uniref:Sucrose phosphorylase n=1 Tax=Fictibacillus barbaricus TaxID=182136 RepID=A0ABS2ZGT0_9BACL|nr:sugar phosphorylase [Fictibacillus barbaricus]MBN3546572.1 sugar phosphorylase [Fictibacillus barbaricus]GGB42088.1 sucrose phosphorylase [Fictibacillus barbaricus]
MENLKERLKLIYSEEEVNEVWPSLKKLIDSAKSKVIKKRKPHWDEKDVVLISYADQFHEENKPTLASFKKMFDRYFTDKFDMVHLLPFYPYSSDDGFSVIDYTKINPISGDWEDLEHLSGSTRLMFDYVCNHISAKSEWFQKYLQGDPEFKDFFVVMDPSVDLSSVTRPRATPVLTKFKKDDGTEEYIWTTFSEDQIDLNFKNPKVLVKMIEVLLFYLEQGAEYVRLDAVGFMWKEVGTTCIHLEKTHQIIKLFRDIADEVSEGTVLITETNVPHKDNISYFGNGEDEAQMVYQFPLPPLVLYSILQGNGSAIIEWAKNLELPGKQTTFFNFLASHDGIGLNPIRGIIPEEEILKMVDGLKGEGALVNYKNNPDGSKSPYEINVTYMDALNKQSDHDEIRTKRFLVAHSILLTLPGVPAVYIQSMLGSRNDYEGVSRTGMNRSINRQKYDVLVIEQELTSTDTLRHSIFEELTKIIVTRKEIELLHPDVAMEVLDLDERLFAFKRISDDGNELLVIHNLANESVECKISGDYLDLLTGNTMNFDTHSPLDPYQFLWLKPIQ